MSAAEKWVPKEEPKKKPQPVPSWDYREYLGEPSAHHFFCNDRVSRVADGQAGTVVQATRLYAILQWDSGECVEIEQFDAAYEVTIRNNGPDDADCDSCGWDDEEDWTECEDCPFRIGVPAFAQGRMDVDTQTKIAIDNIQGRFPL